MAIVKIVNNNYSSRESVYDLMNYIANPLKCSSLAGGGMNVIGSIYDDPTSIAQQFICVQGYGRFKRRLYHVVVSPDSILDNPDNKLLREIGNQVAWLYNDYQSVYTIHENNKDKIHMHIVFNNCPCVYGKKNLTEYFNWYSVLSMVESVIYRNLGIPEKYSKNIV